MTLVYLVLQLFVEIEAAYGSSDRHYHNLLHIDALLELSNQYQDHLGNKEAVDFSIFYHDIIYKVSRSDNEEKSAEMAAGRLKALTFPSEKISTVAEYIIASKTHTLNARANENDLAWFLDFDMSILGADWKTYFQYSQEVRKEYMIYPDMLYQPARKQFLQRTLEMPFIFNTNQFSEQYERQARINLQKELSLL